MILAKVFRGETVESVHRGHLLIIDGDGREVVSVGDPETLAFIRSSAKPFQVMPFLMCGGAERFGFLESEVALACASHSGEKIHTTIAANMLRKAGLTETDLRCGSHLPFNEAVAEEMIRAGEKPTQIHNNCSGKHAAMLAYALCLGSDLGTYHRIENPVQQQILKVVSKFTGTPVEDIPVAIDGCAAPNFALSVRARAKAVLKLVFPPREFTDEMREACRRVITAMMNYPELVGGTDRLDTLLMQAARGKFVSKIGAEGVWLCGVLPSPEWPRGLGISLKIEDGDDRRARPVIAIELLRQLGLLQPDALSDYSPLPVRNRAGEAVGWVEANIQLPQA